MGPENLAGGPTPTAALRDATGADGTAPAGRRYVFVAGCPRTGTSALALLLNEHPSVAIGFERFKRVRASVEPFHFEPRVFCNPTADETDVFVPGFYQHLAQKFEQGDVTVVGDKVPMYTEALDHLQETFPDCRIVMTVRELEATAASFKARASDPLDVWSETNDHLAAPFFWNGALHAAREFEAAGHGDQLLLVPYDELFDGQRLWLEVLLDFLWLPSTPLVARAYEEAVVAARARANQTGGQLPARAREAVLAERDEQLDAWWRQRTELQGRNFRGRLRASGDAPAAEPTTTIPFPAEVREELFQALKAPPKSDEELSGLELRVGAQMRELAERGRRLSSLEKDLAATRAERDGATRAREGMTLEIQELAGRSAASRERLSASLTEAGTELEAERAARRGAAERVGELDRELAGSRAELASVVAELTTRTARVEELEVVINSHDRDRATVIDRQDRDRAELQERIGQLEQRAQELDMQLAETASSLEQAAALLTEREQQLEQVTGERDRARARIKSDAEAAGAVLRRLQDELKDAHAARSRAAEGRLEREQLTSANAELERRMAFKREQLTSANAELERRMALRGEELDAAARALVTIESAVDSLQQIIAELRAEAGELRISRSDLLARLDALTLHNDGLAQAVSERERSESALRGELNDLELDGQRRKARLRSVETELTARITALDGELEARERTLGRLELDHRRTLEGLELERQRTLEDIRRAASSRAWRWGHAVTRLLRTITFRRSVRSAGALDMLVQRLEAAPLSLPAGEPTPASEKPTGAQ